MTATVALIGGTGVGDRLLALGGQRIHVPTPEGLIRIQLIEFNGVKIAILGRHGVGHRVPPHLVPYAGMVGAIKQLGCKACLATAAVGSLRVEWSPGTLLACRDFIDQTGRNQTMFNREVIHRDFTKPMGTFSRIALLEAGREVGVVDGGVYLSSNGPRYETPAEIEAFRILGGELVGMTAATEAVLFREAQIEYACLAIVTNLAAGLSPTELSHAEVVDEMNRSGEKAVSILLKAATLIAQRV